MKKIDYPDMWMKILMLFVCMSMIAFCIYVL